MGALALTRKRHETLVLIDDTTGQQLAELLVGKLKGNSVQLIVRGRSDVRIMRGELIDRDSADVVVVAEAEEPELLDAPCLSPLALAARAVNAQRAG